MCASAESANPRSSRDMSNDIGECQVLQTQARGQRPRTLLGLSSSTRDRTWSQMPNQTSLTFAIVLFRDACAWARHLQSLDS